MGSHRFPELIKTPASITLRDNSLLSRSKAPLERSRTPLERAKTTIERVNSAVDLSVPPPATLYGVQRSFKKDEMRELLQYAPTASSPNQPSNVLDHPRFKPHVDHGNVKYSSIIPLFSPVNIKRPPSRGKKTPLPPGSGYAQNKLTLRLAAKSKETKLKFKETEVEIFPASPKVICK